MQWSPYSQYHIPLKRTTKCLNCKHLVVLFLLELDGDASEAHPQQDAKR